MTRMLFLCLGISFVTVLSSAIGELQQRSHFSFSVDNLSDHYLEYNLASDDTKEKTSKSDDAKEKTSKKEQKQESAGDQPLVRRGPPGALPPPGK
jgi:chromatin remodeling complex protein RSC6